MFWTQCPGVVPRHATWLFLTIVVGASCSTSGMNLPSRSPEAPEAQDAPATDPSEDADLIADVKTADVDAPAPSSVLTAALTAPATADPRPGEAALISALDDRAHAWFRLLAAGDYEGAAGMTGGTGSASALAYWWEAMASERGRLVSLQVLGIESSESYYTVAVRCDFEQGSAPQVQLMIRGTTRDVVSWRRTVQGEPPTPEAGAAAE